MTFDSAADFADAIVSVAPSPATSGLTLTLNTGQGSLFPTPPFLATVCTEGIEPTAQNAEVVRVLTMTGDAVTSMTRHIAGIARTIVPGDRFVNSVTAEVIVELEMAVARSVRSSTGAAANAILAPPPSGDTSGAQDAGVINGLMAEASSSGNYGAGVKCQLQDGKYYGAFVLQPLVSLIGDGHGVSRMIAPAGSSAPVLGSPASGAWMGGVEVAGITLDGNKHNGATGRGLDFYHSNGTQPSNLQRAFDHDPNPLIHHLMAVNCYDHGIALRSVGSLQPMAHDLMAFFCALHQGYGLYIAGPDCIVGRCQVGGSGYDPTSSTVTNAAAVGVYLDGSQDACGQFHDIKAWYNPANFEVNGVHLGTLLSDCRSEDSLGAKPSTGIGMYLTGANGPGSGPDPIANNCHSVVVKNFQSGGDGFMFYLDGYVEGCDLEGFASQSDLGPYYSLVGIGSNNVTKNSIRAKADPAVAISNPLQLFAGATTANGNIVQQSRPDSPMVPAQGLVTLAAGTVAVADTSITTGARVRVTRQATGGTPGHLSVALTAGTGFTINSSSGSDTSGCLYEILSY